MLILFLRICNNLTIVKLFYDDEGRNKEVTSLGAPSPLVCFHHIDFTIKGVTFVLVPDGLNDRVFEKGLDEWRKSHPVQVTEDAGGDLVRDNTEL
jgi:magnesium-dependent phosphatase 1